MSGCSFSLNWFDIFFRKMHCGCKQICVCVCVCVCVCSGSVPFFKDINIFIQLGHIKLIKSDIQKISISNKCCYFKSSVLNRENLIISRFPQKYYSAQVFSTFIIIINDSWASNQHIRIIFEGSCDTEDWINDAENTALHHRNKLHFKIYSNRKTVIIFHNIHAQNKIKNI